MKKKLFASAATVAVVFSTLAPLVPADAAPRQPLSHSQCTRLRGVQPWVPGYLNAKYCSGLRGQAYCRFRGTLYCE